MKNDAVILIRFGAELVPAEVTTFPYARLLGIPTTEETLSVFDVVTIDPDSARQEEHGTSYAWNTLVESKGYRHYLTWALIHRPREYEGWLDKLDSVGVVVQEGEWVRRTVRQLWIAVPPTLTALGIMTLLNRGMQTVEVTSPLLAAHADDLDRAKSDLERIVGWGASDAQWTLALAEVWQSQERLDEAITFWERLSHIMPDALWVREALGRNYARLGVYPHAALEFDRAATLADSTEVRLRLEQARDEMLKRS